MDNNSFIFQLEIFDHMCQKWVLDNIKDKEISLSQKILEVLALHPNLVPEQIADKIGDSIEKVNRELKRITRDTTFENAAFLIDDDEPYDSETLLDFLSDFILHHIIQKIPDRTGNTRFSLSLYGVMLMVYLIRNHNANRIVKSLFLMDKINIQHSLDTISNNYSNTLPLIFGQWDLLKSILKIMSVYDFDVIIDRQARSYILQTPALLNGSKEFYDALQGISLHSRKQLMDIFESGISLYTNYLIELDSKKMRLEKEDQSYRIKLTKEKKELEKQEIIIKFIKNKLDEISFILRYSYNREIRQNTSEIQKYSKLLLYTPSTVTILQRAFANEITFLYYISQNRDTIYLPVLLPAPDYNKEWNIPPTEEEAKIFWSREYDKYSLAPQRGHLLPRSSKERFFDILRDSTQIRESLIGSIKDCRIFHDQTSNIMVNLSMELDQLR